MRSWDSRLRNWEPSDLANRWFGNLLLGLLGFALVTSLIRTGVYSLEIPPSLHAVPVMLIALGCVHGARWISAYEPDPRQVALLRLGGYVLAGLAFALALARPPETSALFSGNTLAVAVLGLLLFGGSLRAEHQPAYLYLGFAAFFLGYFGAYYFVRDLLLPIEGPARQVLIWASRLPGPYRAINGLLFNLLLGILALSVSLPLEGRAIGPPLPLPRRPIFRRGLCLQRVRAAGGDDLYVGLHGPLSAGNPGLRSASRAVPGDCFAGRSGLLRFDPPAGNHPRRAGAGRRDDRVLLRPGGPSAARLPVGGIVPVAVDSTQLP